MSILWDKSLKNKLYILPISNIHANIEMLKRVRVWH